MITKKRIDRKERLLYYLILACIILYVLQGLFIPVIILNKPLKLIFLVVLLLIVASLFFTRNRFLFLGQSPNDDWKTRVLVIGFNTFKYFVAFGMIYYFSISLVFSMYVKYMTPLGSSEFYTIPITQLDKGTSRSAPSIGFYFKEKFNTISGNQFSEISKNTEDRFNPNLELTIACRKAIFNSYLVDSYDIK